MAALASDAFTRFGPLAIAAAAKVAVARSSVAAESHAQGSVATSLAAKVPVLCTLGIPSITMMRLHLFCACNA